MPPKPLGIHWWRNPASPLLPFEFSFGIYFIYFYCSPRLIFALCYTLWLSPWLILLLMLEVLHTNSEIYERNVTFDWLSIWTQVCLHFSFRFPLVLDWVEKVGIKNLYSSFYPWQDSKPLQWTQFLHRDIFIEKLLHLKNILHIPIWITKYTEKTRILVELKAWGYVGYTLMETAPG